MKEIIKTAAKLFAKLIMIGFMCIIVVLSISVIANGLFSKKVGYIAVGTKENSETRENLYTYYYADGEDTERAKYEAEGYTIEESVLKQLSKKGDTVTMLVTQLFCIMLLASFIYSTVWSIGFKDSNLVRFKHATKDTLKGFKIGLFTIIPSLILYLFVLITQNGLSAKMPLSLYELLNAPSFGFISLVVGKATYVNELSVIGFIILFILQFIIPLICHISYILGFKGIYVSELIVYKKDKKDKK